MVWMRDAGVFLCGGVFAQQNIDSTCWSRSNDLWVMSPTRFLCAKVLAQPHHTTHINTHSHHITHTKHDTHNTHNDIYHTYNAHTRPNRRAIHAIRAFIFSRMHSIHTRHIRPHCVRSLHNSGAYTTTSAQSDRQSGVAQAHTRTDPHTHQRASIHATPRTKPCKT